MRGSKVVAHRSFTLPAGTKSLKVTIPAGASAGAAKLKLTFKDSAGNSKGYARTVHIRGS